MRLQIVAEASAGLLCRILGVFAQLGTAAPDMVVTVTADTMVVMIEYDQMLGEQGAIVVAKIARFIGVETVELAEQRVS